MKGALFCVLIALCSPLVQAQEWSFSAQLRERSEFNMKSHTPGDGPDVYHLLRTRLRADAVLDDVQIAFELQDSRLFGIEETTLNTGIPPSGFTTGFDVRNAWLRLHDVASSGLRATVGRMSLDYGNSRFIGSREPYNVTQSFNGLVLSRDFGAVRAEAFALMLRDRNFAEPGLPLTSYLVDGSCFGTWIDYEAADALRAEGFFIHDTPILAEPALQNHPLREAFDGVRQVRHTTGVRLVADPGLLHIDAEGAYQFGTLPGDELAGRPERSIAANFYALALGTKIPGAEMLTLTAGYEHHSGDRMQAGITGDAFEMFSTLHGNVYQYHGFINYFQGQYAHSTSLRNNGLREIYVRLDARLSETVAVYARFQSFREAEDPAEYIGPDTPYGSALGMEANIWCAVKFTNHISMAAATTLFETDSQRAEALGVKKTTNWSYILWLFQL